MKFYLLPLLLLIFACSQSTDQADSISDVAPEKTEVEAPEEDESKPVIEKQETNVVQAGTAETPEEFIDIDWQEYEASMTKEFSFVIILSSKSYDAALQRANEASEKLGYPMDLRGLHENKEIGLSLSRKVCEEEICGGGLDYPIYLPRSDWGDSKYVSVEYSDGFEGFTKGYYIVVIASGEKGNPIVKEALSDAKKFYNDAYAKTCGVWMGCGC